LAGCRNARPALLDNLNRHTLCYGLDKYFNYNDDDDGVVNYFNDDDDDGVDIITPLAAPPVPFMW
jgi:hypothetical protein